VGFERVHGGAHRVDVDRIGVGRLDDDLSGRFDVIADGDGRQAGVTEADGDGVVVVRSQRIEQVIERTPIAGADPRSIGRETVRRAGLRVAGRRLREVLDRGYPSVETGGESIREVHRVRTEEVERLHTPRTAWGLLILTRRG
jgi:hypothetical protein